MCLPAGRPIRDKHQAEDSMPSSTKHAKRKMAGRAKAMQLAQEKGALSYDDLNEILPENASAEDIDEVMVMLGDMDIDIVDEFRVDTESQQRQKEREAKARRAEVRREAAQSRLERADDPRAIRLKRSIIAKNPGFGRATGIVRLR